MSTTSQPVAVITGSKDALGEAPSDNAAAGLLVATWCRSVGSTWTLELHELHQNTTLGTIRDWISSGVPILQPAPSTTLARALLAEHGLELIRDSATGLSTHTRRPIGYVRAITAPTARGREGNWATRLPRSAVPVLRRIQEVHGPGADLQHKGHGGPIEGH
ncbi:MAG TPA: hypothetical protein VFN75_08930 [Pseudonocardiaceae bacterium]|nr:hypothetical protein [Pseudonocardiaceae bacterium]